GETQHRRGRDAGARDRLGAHRRIHQPLIEVVRTEPEEFRGKARERAKMQLALDQRPFRSAFRLIPAKSTNNLVSEHPKDREERRDRHPRYRVADPLAIHGVSGPRPAGLTLPTAMRTEEYLGRPAPAADAFLLADDRQDGLD